MCATYQRKLLSLAIVLAAGILASTLATGAEPAQEDVPSVAALVKQLDADEYGRREEASRQLEELGAKAVPALTQAAQNRSLEVSARAFAIFRTFVAADDTALQAAACQALKQIADQREAARKNNDDALATAAATATEILGRPFLGLFGDRTADSATVGSVVQGSPAEKQGLKAGDVVLSFAGAPTPTFSALIEAVAKKTPGDGATLEIERDGKKIVVELVVGRFEGWPQALTPGWEDQ